MIYPSVFLPSVIIGYRVFECELTSHVLYKSDDLSKKLKEMKDSEKLGPQALSVDSVVCH